jgi:hypothetical protein
MKVLVKKKSKDFGTIPYFSSVYRRGGSQWDYFKWDRSFQNTEYKTSLCMFFNKNFSQ